MRPCPSTPTSLVSAKPLEPVETTNPPLGATGMSQQDRLVYSVAEAGALLGISRAFAYELVARGELPVIRLGRRRLVPKVALAALFADQPSGDGSQ